MDARKSYRPHRTGRRVCNFRIRLFPQLTCTGTWLCSSTSATVQKHLISSNSGMYVYEKHIPSLTALTDTLVSRYPAKPLPRTSRTCLPQERSVHNQRRTQTYPDVRRPNNSREGQDQS